MGHDLYNLLVKELVPFLRQGDHIIVVPDEILATLPFEAFVVAVPDHDVVAPRRNSMKRQNRCPVRIHKSPIALQEVVPVMPEDTVDSLSALIIEREHGLYVLALNLVMSGNYRLEGRSVLPLGDRT